MSSISNLSAKQLRKAASLTEKIEALNRQLAAIVGGSAPKLGRPPGRPAGRPPGRPPGQARKKPKFSAAARAAIAAAQRARWAKIKAAKK